MLTEEKKDCSTLEGNVRSLSRDFWDLIRALKSVGTLSVGNVCVLTEDCPIVQWSFYTLLLRYSLPQDARLCCENVLYCRFFCCSFTNAKQSCSSSGETVCDSFLSLNLIYTFQFNQIQPAGCHLPFWVKCLYLVDYHEIWYRHSCCPQNEL